MGGKKEKFFDGFSLGIIFQRLYNPFCISFGFKIFKYQQTDTKKERNIVYCYDVGVFYSSSSCAYVRDRLL